MSKIKDLWTKYENWCKSIYYAWETMTKDIQKDFEKWQKSLRKN